MEEQLMFTQVHDALDIPTPPGAFERLRTELTKKPVRPRRWPAFQMRNSTMGFRLAAGLAVVAIAVAAAAAVLAIHNSTNNTSPAGSRMSIQAYQKLINADSPDPNRIWTSPCDDTHHTGCADDATRSIPVIQKWYDDVSRVQPPVRFAAVNEEMRQHLDQNLTALHALLRDSQANDDPAMTRDFDVAVYAVNWTGVIVTAIVQSHEVSASTYVALLRSESATFNGCGAACGLTPTSATCTTSDGLTCWDYFGRLAYSLSTYQADLITRAAPGSLAAADAKIQSDLAQLDAVLLTMNLAVAAQDQAGFNSGIAQVLKVKTQLDLDTAQIIG